MELIHHILFLGCDAALSAALTVAPLPCKHGIHFTLEPNGSLVSRRACLHRKAKLHVF